MDYDVVEERISKIERILARLPAIEKRLEDIDKQIMYGGFTARQFNEMITERSCLRLERQKLEKKAKEEYKLLLDKESEELIIDTDNLE